MNKLLCLLLVVFYSGSCVNAQDKVRIDTLDAYSPALKRNFKSVVYTPAGIGQPKRFPVVYILHGYSGSFRDWPAHMKNLGDYAFKYKFIIVCPDGGYSSWYINSPIDKSSQMESFLATDLPAIIDRNYPTIKSRKKRAVTGLSMGGHGALMIAMKYPQVFGSASSMSGTLDLEQIVGKYESEKIFGERGSNPFAWTTNSVLHLSKKIKDKRLNLLIECGSEDYFITGNRAVHSELLKRKITHSYIEKPGNHTWEYWTTALPYHLLFFHHQFQIK
jgi:S-formylglutathione hydrolase FrmB